MAEMLGVAISAMFILLLFFRRYERSSLRFVEWVTLKNVNLALFMFGIFVIPVILILV